MKWTRPAMLGTAMLLWGCGGPAGPQDVPPIGRAPSSPSTQVVRPMTAVSGLTSSVGLSGVRRVEKDTLTKYSWSLLKEALPTNQLTTTQARVNFRLTATRTTQTTSSIGKSATVLSTPADAPLSICNPFGVDVMLVKSDFKLSMRLYDAQGAELAGSPVDVTAAAAFVEPTVVSASMCRQWSLSMSSADYPAFDGAARFRLSVSASGTANGSSYATSAESPQISLAEEVVETVREQGDRSVDLSDPDLNFFKSIDGTFSQVLSRVVTCADTAQLTVNPGQANGYVFNNTAYLIGQSTDLSSSAKASLQLKCAQGCTYTQGYYKTHGSVFHGQPNKKYDAQAWRGAPLLIGNVSYSQLQLLRIYDTPVAGNQAIALFHQLATALLNLSKDPAAGAPNSVMSTISSAQTFFRSNPSWLMVPTAAPSDWINLLDNFNNGKFSQHCD